MQNITELRNSLIENYTKTKAGKMGLNMCKELTNTAGKIINSLKVEQDEKIRLKDTTPIAFLQTFDIPKVDESQSDIKLGLNL